MLENIEEISLLLDFYGELLADKQKEFLKLYHEDNLSLTEIADEYGVSRQAVSDAVKKAQNSLRAYEEKLGLLSRFKKQDAALTMANNALDALIDERRDDKELVCRLKQIRKMTDLLGD